MQTTDLGLLFGLGGDRFDLIFHVFDLPRELVIFIEELAEMGILHFQLMDALAKLGELVYQVVVLNGHV